jgi:hypothetical protein
MTSWRGQVSRWACASAKRRQYSHGGKQCYFLRMLSPFSSMTLPSGIGAR